MAQSRGGVLLRTACAFHHGWRNKWDTVGIEANGDGEIDCMCACSVCAWEKVKTAETRENTRVKIEVHFVSTKSLFSIWMACYRSVQTRFLRSHLFLRNLTSDILPHARSANVGAQKNVSATLYSIFWDLRGFLYPAVLLLRVACVCTHGKVLWGCTEKYCLSRTKWNIIFRINFRMTLFHVYTM
jgi:hypothetical protein